MYFKNFKKCRRKAEAIIIKWFNHTNSINTQLIRSNLYYISKANWNTQNEIHIHVRNNQIHIHQSTNMTFFFPICLCASRGGRCQESKIIEKYRKAMMEIYEIRLKTSFLFNKVKTIYKPGFKGFRFNYTILLSHVWLGEEF